MVEGTGLENRQRGNPFVGSNPTLSASHEVHRARCSADDMNSRQHLEFLTPEPFHDPTQHPAYLLHRLRRGRPGFGVGPAQRRRHADGAWDILFPEAGGEKMRSAADRSACGAPSPAQDAVAGADIVLAAVTAASSLDAAMAAKPYLRPDQFYLDINSVSPGRKQETAQALDGAVRYVDVAVMAPVHPALHKTPMLLAGPHADAPAPAPAGARHESRRSPATRSAPPPRSRWSAA